MDHLYNAILEGKISGIKEINRGYEFTFAGRKISMQVHTRNFVHLYVVLSIEDITWNEEEIGEANRELLESIFQKIQLRQYDDDNHSKTEKRKEIRKFLETI